MKLYKILGGIAFMCLIIGIAGICGAIECGTGLKESIGIFLIGCACAWLAIRESGGYYEDF